MEHWKDLLQEAASIMQEAPVVDGQALRRNLEERYGPFSRARYLEKEALMRRVGSRALIGVDGSVNRYGTTFPYIVYLYRALAGSTREQEWPAHDFFCPVRPADRQQVADLCRGGLQTEEALARLYWKNLALLEARVACTAAREGNAFLLLLDGGFGRLATHAPASWEELQATCLDQGIMLAGVIEETGSNLVGSALGYTSDRAVFFGNLAPGEYLAVPGERPEWWRVYARLSRHPQAVAVELLADQADCLPDVMDFLYTATPARGRGIPLWLDIVDRRARITRRQMQVILRQGWEPAVFQKFIYPQRERRVL